MTKTAQEIQQELDAYLSSKTEKDLSQSDNRLLGIQLRTKDPEWHKRNNQRRIDDPNYDKKVGKKISQAYSTPEMRAVQASKSKPHTQEAKEKIRHANQGKQRKGESWIKGMSEKKKGNNHRCRPIVTPLGIFSSKKNAAEVYLASGRSNAIKWIEKWLKTEKDKFYYISKEEYILLTGKEI